MGRSNQRSTKAWLLVLGSITLFHIAFGVETTDYLESLKDDEEPLGPKEAVTEYPNGVNVIPGEADIHYPIYSKIPRSSFNCHGRRPGFYANTDLRCQVWHICDEAGTQQDFLCTNGTIYSQDKRVCDWWYNVNCDPEEVSRNYEQNEELYKGPPPKKNADHVLENDESNDLPPQEPQHQQHQRRNQEHHARNQQHQQQQRQEVEPTPRRITDDERPYTVQDRNSEPSQSNRQSGPPPPPAHKRTTGNPPSSATPEKKRVIVLRLPGPLPPGATIPPHVLMQYAESVLAAERAGKAPPTGLQDLKSVQHQNSNRQQAQQRPRPQPTTAPTTQAPPPPPQQQQQQQGPPPQPKPRGPILPYTPRPFSAFLEQAIKFNGQSKNQQRSQQQENSEQNYNQNRPTQPTPQTTQRQTQPSTPQPTRPHQPQQQHQSSNRDQEQNNYRSPQAPQQQQKPTQEPSQNYNRQVQQQSQSHSQQQNHNRQQQQRPSQDQQNRQQPEQRPSQDQQQQQRPSQDQQQNQNRQQQQQQRPSQNQQRRPEESRPRYEDDGQYREQHNQQRPSQSQNQQRRPEESRPNYEDDGQYREQQQQPQRPNEEKRQQTQQNYEQEEQYRTQPPQQQRQTTPRPTPPPQNDAPLPEKKPLPAKAPVPKPHHHAAPEAPHKKFRHSTPRKTTNVKFAPKSQALLDAEESGDFAVEESRRPAYPFDFNSFTQQSKPSYAEQPQTSAEKEQVYSKSATPLSFQVKPRRQKQQQQQQEYKQVYIPEAIARPTTFAPEETTSATPLSFQVKPRRQKQQQQQEYKQEYIPEAIAPTTFAPEKTTVRRLVVVTKQALKIKDPRQQQQVKPTEDLAPVTFSEEIPRGTYETVKIGAVSKTTPLTTTTNYVPPTTTTTRRPTTVQTTGRTTTTTSTTEASSVPFSPEYEYTTLQPTRRVIKKTKLRPITTTTGNYYEQQQQQGNYDEPRYIASSTEPSALSRITEGLGLDIYGRNENDDEEEELIRAAKLYLQASESYGKRKRL